MNARVLFIRSNPEQNLCTVYVLAGMYGELRLDPLGPQANSPKSCFLYRSTFRVGASIGQRQN